MIQRNCKYNDGAFCNKGLPGTQCDIYGCVAYMPKDSEHAEKEEN